MVKKIKKLIATESDSAEKYTSKLSGIYSLETFDAHAFVQDGRASQAVCNFILSLACVYNDFKDTTLALEYLAKVQPPSPNEETATCGEYNGIRMHIIRSQLALIHELIDLIKRESKTIEDSFFQEVISQVDKVGSHSWKTLVDVSQGKIESDKIARALLMIRNKISFHYDSKEIFKGYKKLFLDSTEKKAYISRGDTLNKERYYFAEAAAQMYFYGCTEEAEVLERILDVMAGIPPALSQIIKLFIQKRGYGWRNV
ncbi:MAG: hypothetical protein ABSB95_10180 [Dissulfurispiraceae bacterium]|jgi:hypothetical protein